MPRFDGTGPQGKGPKTGRGLGRCFNSTEQQPQQDVQQQYGSKGFGMGIGRKQGRCMLRIRGNR
jgi:hypothetical protein